MVSFQTNVFLPALLTSVAVAHQAGDPGQPDRSGRALRSTEVGVADEVAAAASLLMGQAAEGRPIVILRGFPYALQESNAAALIRSKEMDMFR